MGAAVCFLKKTMACFGAYQITQNNNNIALTNLIIERFCCKNPSSRTATGVRMNRRCADLEGEDQVVSKQGSDKQSHFVCFDF